MSNMIDSGKSLTENLTEDSSAPGCPLVRCQMNPIGCWFRHKNRGHCYCFDCTQKCVFETQRKWNEGYYIGMERTYSAVLKFAMADFADAEKHKEEQDRWRNRKLYKETQARDLGPREFTFTYSPSWYESDTDAQNAMRCAVEKLTRYYKDEIIEFHAIGEFTDAGRAHIHGWYHLDGGRKITDKNFKRAWRHWNPRKKLGRGFEGGHHETIDRVSDFAGYSEKHLEKAWLDIHITNGSQETDSSLSSEDCASSQDDSPSDSSQVQ